MPRGQGVGSRVMTNSKTERTAGHSAEQMSQMGNLGNTKRTKLPGGGKPRGAKKSGK